MKNKYIFSLVLLCSFQLSIFGQNVGVGTDNPQATLDVAGELNVARSVHIGGKLPIPGTEGQFIVSGGEESPAEWKSIQIPAGLGESFSLTSMDSFADMVGVSFNGSSAGHTNPYNVNALFNTTVGWKEIPGLSNNIVLYKPDNKINLHLQTMAQITGGTLASFACGFFVNDLAGDDEVYRLKGVRTDVIIAPSGSYKLFNMNATIENLPPGAYTIKTACIKRNIASGITLGIGKALDTTVLSQSMAQSTLNVFTLERY